MTVYSSYKCGYNRPLAKYIRGLFYYWFLPGSKILDLTAGLNSTTRELFIGSLEDMPIQLTRMDIDVTAKIDVNADLLNVPFQPNSFDVVYIDPPYSKTMGRRGLYKADTRLSTPGNLKQFVKGIKNYDSIMNSLPNQAISLLRPSGSLVIKLQDSQTIPNLTPTIFNLHTHLTQHGFILHDYGVYTYFPKRPSLKPWIDAKRLHVAHGFILNYTVT